MLPTECSACESVMCTLCLEGIAACPVCKGDLVLRDIARFGKKVYAAFVLNCRNQENGCTAQASVSDILQHEQTCEYSLATCHNSLCSNTFYLKNAYNDQMCSSTCFEVNHLETNFACLTKQQILQRLHDILNAMRADVLTEMKAQLEPELNAVNMQLAEIQSFWRTQRLDLEREIDERRHHWHSGKWSTSSKWWSCCHSEETCSIGCKALS